MGTPQLAAFHNIVNAIDVDAHLPDQVFRGTWATFAFFESDHVFSGTFVEIVLGLMHAESATSCYLLNITRTHVMEYQEAVSFVFENSTTGSEYEARLERDGPAEAWIFDMDRYACASDKGEWCIYCEKQNDVAVIGLRHPDGIEKFAKSLKILCAEAIDGLLQKGSAAVVPFSMLTPEWRQGLLRNYQ